MKLRMKVWTSPEGNLYMMAAAYMDLRQDRMVCYAMRDDDTKQLLLTVEQWNALEYHFFEDKGPAPRPERKWTLADAINGVHLP